MATDAEVWRLVGRPVPPTEAWRCGYCPTGIWRVVGVWHPGGPDDAACVVGCPLCGSTTDGGAP